MKFIIQEYDNTKSQLKDENPFETIREIDLKEKYTAKRLQFIHLPDGLMLYIGYDSVTLNYPKGQYRIITTDDTSTIRIRITEGGD